ncbi:hypothetical protein BDV95DRAFT_610313 [Massariosphaeria phaeospora]|uniref:Uncharacterized protein n=1 Tax=Massariosphaeria phaeospora TaxID=100035 RepID=A0A7C8I0Z8_9PLEO|nr:hypothetical protein BDV95DRAFT_610313 [Massariosphaeria phaeospora]
MAPATYDSRYKDSSVFDDFQPPQQGVNTVPFNPLFLLLLLAILILTAQMIIFAVISNRARKLTEDEEYVVGIARMFEGQRNLDSPGYLPPYSLQDEHSVVVASDAPPSYEDAVAN